LVHILGKLGFVISGLVLVYDIPLGQFVNHGTHRFQQLLGFRFIGAILQSLDISTRGLRLVAVL
jgi:hypothetical protein